jgi:hypothetical protein
MKLIGTLRHLPFQVQRKSATAPVFSSLFRHCSGGGNEQGSGGSTIDRQSETKGAMNAYMKKAQDSSPVKPKSWDKSDKSGGKHTQYFAVDDPKAKARAKANSSNESNMSDSDGDEGGGYYSDDDDDGDSYDDYDDGDSHGYIKARKGRRGRGGEDEEDKDFDKKHKDDHHDDDNPMRGITPTVRAYLLS